jgi:hypothetical protein
MDLQIVSSHLQSITKRTTFDAWVSSNIESLTNYFYSLSHTDLKNLEFDTFYFKDFVVSPVFKDFEKTGSQTEPFVAFLNLLSITWERLAQIGITAPIDHISSLLPESSIKYRLKCLSKIINIDNVKKDYLKLFPKILEWLEKSENLGEENNTQKIVDLLIFYYAKADLVLSGKGYTEELAALKDLFLGSKAISKYHFLGHPTIQNVIAGNYPQELVVEDAKSVVLYPSDIVSQLFKYNINGLVFAHPKTKDNRTLLGYDKTTIRSDILNYGKADFDSPFKNLTGHDKVLLYCYFNMKKHFFTSFAVFSKIWPTLSKLLSNPIQPIIFIDLGCGPLTSGLAIADLHFENTKKPLLFHYFGIDISSSMITKAKEFSEADLFDRKSTFDFYSECDSLSMAKITSVAGASSHVFINASYLFASSSLNVKNLAKFVSKLRIHFKYVHFIFQNPDRIDRNIKWTEFKKFITFKLLKTDVEKVVYKTSYSSLSDPGSEDVYFEFLEITEKNAT